jgi:outer membrane protein, heavy metal efflux system
MRDEAGAQGQAAFADRPLGAWALIMRFLFGAAALVLAAGCAGVQKERGHADVGQLVERRMGTKTGWEQGAPADSELYRRVSDLLRPGLTRSRAVQIALVNNPRLQESYEELDISQADMVQAGLLSNPTLAGSIGFRAQGAGKIEYEVSLVQSLLDLLLLPTRKSLAKRQFMAQTLRTAHAALETAAQVSQEFTETQTSQRIVEMMRLMVESADAATSLAESQHEAGNITLRTLSAEKAFALRTSLELSHDELELAERKERLNRLLGLWGPRTGWTLSEQLPELPPRDTALEHLERLAMKQRLDIAAARQEVDLLHTALTLTKTSRFIGVLDVGAHMHQDPDGPRLIGPTLSLELPIFDQRQALIARLEAQQRQAQRHLDGLAIDARSEVRLAHARMQVARAVVDKYRSVLLPTQASLLEQSQLEYNAMQLGLYELLAVKREQIASYRSYLESTRDYWVAAADLERAVGGTLPGLRPPSGAPAAAGTQPREAKPLAPESHQHAH